MINANHVAKVERGLYVGPFRIPGLSEKPKYIAVDEKGNKREISKAGYKILKELGIRDNSSRYTIEV